MRVRPADVGDASRSMAGELSAAAGSLQFTPRFPFADGVTYDVAVEHHDGSTTTVQLTRPTPTGTPCATVVAVRPSVTTIPLNQLRLYVQFSAPMRGGDAARCIALVDDGTSMPIEGAFFSPELELWDPDRRRLTVLFDPARIKRGLVPHRESGYPLHEGRAVQLVIDAAMRDASGQSMVTGFRQRFEVGPAVRTRVDPARWRIAAPAAGSVDPLTVTFDRALDHGLLQHALVVLARDGSAMAGQISIGDDERSWRFVPEEVWRPGRHELAVDPALEDLAGNSVRRVFDRDLADAADDPVATDLVALGFVCHR